MAEKQKVTEEIKIDNHLGILKKYFPNCFDKHGNFNLEKFKEEIKINEINLSKESYSLEWLGKSYARVLTFEPARTLLKADEEWNNKPENETSGNILIKGDNLEALKHLVNAYHEKIKMIYIDPPYNTGNDGFVYQDDRKFTVEELAELAGIDEERAKRILDFVNSKSNSHSAWLTFMYPRLYIARRLLREDGVIFVSIDDNEVAQLRLLMDEIFGEENFVENFIIRSNPRGNQAKKFTASEHEYVLVYSRNIGSITPLGFKKQEYEYNKIDEKGRYREIGLRKRGAGARAEDAPNLFYPIYYNPQTGEICLEKKNDNYVKILPKLSNGSNGRWRWSKDKFIKHKDRLLVRKVRGKGEQEYDVFEKDYYNKNKITKVKSIFYDKEVNYENGTEELDNLFNGVKIYTYPKPVYLIKKLISSVGANAQNNDLILDFFAGSGTTGDAVMQLNAEDGGNRKFILVQIDEPIDPKKNKTAYEFVKNELGEENPTIFHICKERLIRAAKKIIEDKQSELEELTAQIEKIKSKKKLTKKDKEKLDILKEKQQEIIAQLENIEKQDFGFKIFETIPIWEDYLKDEKELTEQTELFNADKLSEEDLKALLITWKTYDGIPLTEDCREIDLGDYIGYYCGNNLYLMHKGWKTDNLKALLEKLDVDENFAPDKIIIFGYNFDSKHLKEIMDNIKNYANKKQIEIETILRF